MLSMLSMLLLLLLLLLLLYLTDHLKPATAEGESRPINPHGPDSGYSSRAPSTTTARATTLLAAFLGPRLTFQA